MRPDIRALLLGLAVAGIASVATAQTAEAPTKSAPKSAASANGKPVAKAAADAPKKHKFNPYQSPLATIMQFRLHPDVPDAQDFVRETRPEAKDLKYTPLQSQLGPEPERPKLRDAAGIDALKTEMEASIAHNEGRVAPQKKSKSKARPAKAAAAAN